MARNPANDIILYLTSLEYLDLDIEISGDVQIVSILDNTLDLNIELSGTWVNGQVFPGTFKDIDPQLLGGDIFIEYAKSNWVKWSKIGHFDFTIDKSNLAGEMPIGWKGDIYRIGQLGSAILVYGSGGISKLNPVDNVFGKVRILSKGIKSKGSVLLLPSYHLAIDKTGCLWRIGEKIERLGYEEYLNLLTNPILHYDEVEDLVYICDGIRGYVFNSDENSLGEGPINLTGIGYHEGNPYFMASDSLTPLGFQVGIDTIDMGNRNFKTIHEVEIGIDSTSTFQLGISFKNGISPTFIGPIWFNVTPEGRCFPNCWGKDHRFYIKTSSPDQFSISYIKVEGQLADFNPLDSGA